MGFLLDVQLGMAWSITWPRPRGCHLPGTLIVHPDGTVELGTFVKEAVQVVAGGRRHWPYAVDVQKM